MDAIVEERACFFLTPPFNKYKIAPTNENACNNLLPFSTYYTPLNTTSINRYPNTVYNVVLFGDSMVDYAILSHNLTGKIVDFLPQYTTNLRFFNKGIPDTSIAQQRDRLESTISSVYEEVRPYQKTYYCNTAPSKRHLIVTLSNLILPYSPFPNSHRLPSTTNHIHHGHP